MNTTQAGVPAFRAKGGEGGYCNLGIVGAPDAIRVNVARSQRPAAKLRPSRAAAEPIVHPALRYEAARTQALEAEVAQLRRDIAERKRTAEHQDLLMHELTHRMKNTLVLVQSIATQTLRTSGSVTEASRAFSTRMAALGKAHDLLTRQGTSNVDLLAVVHAALDLHATQRGRVEISGPDVELKPKAALALSLMLHELATNAAKYGALSNESGRVVIAWSLTEDGKLALSWTEQDGPTVTPPTRVGFGSRLIERSFAGEFDGHTHVVYAPTGVVCTLSAPLARLQG